MDNSITADYTWTYDTKLLDAHINTILTNGANYKSEDVGEEEWVWVTGYKGTDRNMRCRNYQFELNKQHDMPEGEEIRMCSNGFHFCDKLSRVYNYYKMEDGNRFFEVKALVRRWKKNDYYKVEQRDDKMVAKSIVFTRELSIDEIFESLNDDELIKWTSEQKEQARQTSINAVRTNFKIKRLVELGYSEAFATFAVEKCAYEIAETMGMMSDVSMDVKVLTVAMDIFE